MGKCSFIKSPDGTCVCKICGRKALDNLSVSCDRISRRCISRGLGDSIAKATSIIGIKPCGGCKRRQQVLNKLFPYRSKSVRNLHVVSCYFNPCVYNNLRSNYFEYVAGLERAGVDYTTVELVFDDQRFETDSKIKIRGSRRNLLWQKERLLNLAVESLPESVDAIAWIDTDIIFTNENWVADTIKSFEQFQVLQLFERADYLDAVGKVERSRKSTGWHYLHKNEDHGNLRIAHPGFAWAARAEFLRSCKLYEHMITGGGDSLMLAGITGARPHVFSHISGGWLAHAEKWVYCALNLVGGSLGYVPGLIKHLYHGSLVNRSYIRRWEYLSQHGYDPNTDIEIDSNGLLAWTRYAEHNKPELIKVVGDYFALRQEDT